MAVPELQDLLGDGTATEKSILLVGAVLTGTKLAYGFGQLVNGILGDHLVPSRCAIWAAGLCSCSN